MEQIVRLILGAISGLPRAATERIVGEIGWSAAGVVLAAASGALGVLILAAAAWLAMVPEIGAVAATGLLGLAFLAIAAITFAVHRSRRAANLQRARIDAPSLASSITQDAVLRLVIDNAGPLLIAAAVTVLTTSLSRRR